MGDGPLNYGLLDTEEESPFGREPSIANENEAGQARLDSWFNFTRTSTFGNFGEVVFGREMTMSRGVTEALGLNYDSDEAWTRTLIEAYAYGEENDPRVGDVPLPKGFGREGRFWRMIIIVSLLGATMGIFAVGFMHAADKIPSMWVDNGDFDEPKDCQYNQGKWYWVAITTIGGLVVGLIRWIFEYPENIPGLFKDINDYHVEPKWSPLTFVISAISLGCGASLGPEQALGNLGGGIGTWLSEKFTEYGMESDDKKLLVLSGMSGALGALFPTPVCGVLMIYELGNPPRDYMESIVILSSSALCSFVMYYFVLEYSFVDLYSASYVLSFTWDFDLYQCGTAFIIGVVSGVIGLLSIIIIGICRQIFARIRLRLARNKFLQAVTPPVIGGLVVGLVNVALPLTVGDGNMVIQKIIQYGYNYAGSPPEIPAPIAALVPFEIKDVPTEGLSPNLLACTAFAKLFLLGVCMSCGFVGGFVFPMVLVGIIAGVMCFQQFTYLPLGFCVSCFLAAVPGSICPMPFTLACLAIFMSFNGLYQTVPIYIACVTSYTVVCGSGIFTALQLRAVKQAQADRDAELGKLKVEQDTFKVDQYGGNTAHRPAAGAASERSVQ